MQSAFLWNKQKSMEGELFFSRKYKVIKRSSSLKDGEERARLSLSIHLTSNQRVLIVRLTGDLDHHTASDVRNRIEAELVKDIHTHLVLNLENLQFMDSSGLGVILGRYKQMSSKGGKMYLCSVQPSVFKLMEMSGLFQILPTYQDECSAISACEVAS
jgi:stage II sporulation protein AA (anti-sigma F factor antagonist)